MNEENYIDIIKNDNVEEFAKIFNYDNVKDYLIYLGCDSSIHINIMKFLLYKDIDLNTPIFVKHRCETPIKTFFELIVYMELYDYLKLIRDYDKKITIDNKIDIISYCEGNLENLTLVLQILCNDKDEVVNTYIEIYSKKIISREIFKTYEYVYFIFKYPFSEFEEAILN